MARAFANARIFHNIARYYFPSLVFPPSFSVTRIFIFRSITVDSVQIQCFSFEKEFFSFFLFPSGAEDVYKSALNIPTPVMFPTSENSFFFSPSRQETENLYVQRRRVRPMYNNSARNLREGVRNRESSHVFIQLSLRGGRSLVSGGHSVSPAVVEPRHVVFIILS